MLCETTAKTDSDRSTASIGKLNKLYDVTNSVEYETETAPLTSFECQLLEQMFTSHSVKRPDEDNGVDLSFDSLNQILITDFTCEISDSNSDVNTVKFTWQFENNSPKLKLQQSSGIFNNQYNFIYS